MTTQDEEEDVHKIGTPPGDNLNNGYTPYIFTTVDLFYSAQSQSINPTSILLDSCSTGNIISNKNLLHGFYKAPIPMPVKCNAGTVTLTHQAYFGNYPEPVWYHPNGIANIMSLNNVQQYYRVTLDSSKENIFYLHTNANVQIPFRPCSRGLYQASSHDIATDNHHKNYWSMLQTVDQQCFGIRRQVAA